MKLVSFLLISMTLSAMNAHAEDTTNPDKVYPIEIVGRSWINANGIENNLGLIPLTDQWFAYNYLIIGGIVLGGDPSVSNDTDGFAKDGKYRLWSQFKLLASVKNGDLTVIVASQDKDGGAEGAGLFLGSINVAGFRGEPAPPTLVKVGNRYDFGYVCWGAPAPIPAASLLAIRPRTSVNIWHRIVGNIWVENGVVKYAFQIYGCSSFPSHCLNVNGVQVHTLPQGLIDGLWFSDPSIPLWVIRRTTPPGQSPIQPLVPVPFPLP
jgi:hypothetical protein